LKCRERQKWREELSNNTWPHIKEEFALRWILIVNSVTEESNLGILAYMIQSEFENKVEKAEMWRCGKQDLDCTYERSAINNLDEKTPLIS
jgi:hypothetical protein